MFVRQFFVKGLAHSSYLVAGAQTCAIVDPRRDVQVYLDAAKDMGMKITHILETHLHADFIMFEWAKAGLPTAHLAQLSSQELGVRFAFAGIKAQVREVVARAEWPDRLGKAMDYPTLDAAVRDLRPALPIGRANPGRKESTE